MSAKTKIEWTDSTWNPWHGCIKVSAGCKNCYMYREKNRYGQDPMEVKRSKTTFSYPLRWKKPRMIFTCSWSDFFIEQADAWRNEAWDIIRNTPQHTYQILTKRPERITEHLPDDWGEKYKHVWIGVSVESQELANIRIPIFLESPAFNRFISAEPLLGPVTFDHWPLAKTPWPAINWVIVGGESGPNFRDINPEWARNIRDECKVAGIPFFMKQMAGTTKQSMQKIPEDLLIQEIP